VRQFVRAGLIRPRAEGRVKWLLCAPGSPPSGRQLRGLLKASL
jgi:hypothetical protein